MRGIGQPRPRWLYFYEAWLAIEPRLDIADSSAGFNRWWVLPQLRAHRSQLVEQVGALGALRIRHAPVRHQPQKHAAHQHRYATVPSNIRARERPFVRTC